MIGRIRSMSGMGLVVGLALAGCSSGSGGGADAGIDSPDAGSADSGLAIDPVADGVLADVPEIDSGDAQNPCKPTGLSQSFIDQLQKVLEDGAAQGKIPGALLSIDLFCEGTWTGATGMAKTESKTPMTPDVVLRIASVTKTYTAAAILELAEQGKIALADPIDKHVPGVPGGDKITLEMLANHTSGLFDYVDDPDVWAKRLDPSFKPSPAELVAAAVAHPPYFAPGGGWHYSNTNYILLGMVVEKASGKTISQAIRDLILKPNGLESTWFEGEESLPAGTLIADGYLATEDKVENVTARVNPFLAWAAGAIEARVSDVTAWGRALFTGGLFEEATRKALMSCVPTGEEGTEWGFGIMCLTTPIGKMYGHAGGIDGYSSLVLFVPSKQAVVTILANLEKADMDPFMIGVSMALMSH